MVLYNQGLQTIKNIAKRFPNRKLAKAINKHGFDKFSIHLLGIYPEGILEQKRN